MKPRPLVRLRQWCDGRNAWRRMVYRVCWLVALPFLLTSIVLERLYGCARLCAQEAGQFLRDLGHDLCVFARAFWRGTPRG